MSISCFCFKVTSQNETIVSSIMQKGFHYREMRGCDIRQEKKERLAPFAFSLCDIPIGATIEYSNNADEKSGLTCVVIDDHTVEYDGKRWSLSALATELTQSKWSVAGPRYFKYNGEWLNDIRHRLGR